MKNDGDKNCKKMHRERSGRKEDSFWKGDSRLGNLREGCVKKTVAPAVSKAE